MTAETQETEPPQRRRVCEHGVPLGAPCDDPTCYNHSDHRCTTMPCRTVGCENSRPVPLEPNEAFELGLREARAAERDNPNPADYPPEAVSIWEETQRLAARESNSSAMPGAMLGRDEDGRVGYMTEPWEHRQPQATPDLHHDQPIVLGSGDSARLMFQQATPMHTSGAMYRKKTPRSRVHLKTEREAAEEIAERDAAARGQLAVLSPVERELVEREARGEKRAAIARAMGLTERQVKRGLEKARAKVRATRPSKAAS